MTYLDMDTGLSAEDLIKNIKQKKGTPKQEEKTEPKDVEEAAREALKKNELEEDAEHKTEKETFERIVAIEGLRREVSTLEDFVNDSANKEIVESSPELAASIRNKKRALDVAEHSLDEDGSQMSTSIEGVATEVRDEMSVQYLIDNKPSLAGFKRNSDIGWTRHRRHFTKAYDNVDGSIGNLPGALDSDEVSPGTRKKIIEKFKDTAVSNLLATKKESKGDFDSDYAIWKDFYISLHAAAGVQVPNDRTNENIVFGRYQHSHPYEFDFGVFESENPIGGLNKQADEHKKYFHSLTDASSILRKAREAEGFLGLGTVKKKLNILKGLDMSFDVGLLQSGNYWRQRMNAGEVEATNVDELDRRLDDASALASSKIEEAQRMNKVYDLALQKAPEIAQVMERTPVVLMWKAELYQHVAAKMDELEKALTV